MGENMNKNKIEELRELGFVVQDDGFIGMEADEVYEIVQSIKLGKRNKLKGKGFIRDILWVDIRWDQVQLSLS